ncbi:hypothetical protein [Spirosoma pulveris]
MDKIIRILCVVCLLTLMMSCGTSKRVYTGNRLYRVAQVTSAAGVTTKELEIFESDKPAETSFMDKSDHLLFSAIPSNFKPQIQVIIPTNKEIDYTQFLPSSTAVPVGVQSYGKPFYTVSDLDSNPKKVFQYGDGKFVLQAINVTLKIRPKSQRDISYYPATYTASQIQAAIDSFPTQAEAGINLGLAFGYKFNYNRFRVVKDAFGRNTNQFSVAPAVMLGTGVTDITSTNTRILRLVSRKEPFFSFGGVVMIGFNNINIGYATGWDWAIGEHGDRWIYSGKRWNGIVIALDVIK